MKKLLTLTALLFTCVFAFGQNYPETAGFVKNGEEKEYHYNGQLSAIGIYVKGAKEGKWTYYDEQGKLKKTGNYTNDKTAGEWKFYDKDGNLSDILNYENGLSESYYTNGKLKSKGKNVTSVEKYYKTGTFETYNEFTSELETLESFKKGKPIGEYIIYGRNGDLKEIGNYDENGKLSGEWKEYYYSYLQNSDNKYPKATLKVTGYFKNGNTTGEWKLYYENGNLNAVGHFENNEKTGEWKYYDEKGNLIKTEKY
jgi:antitoxin component YwqK of YwqJK toxin-antitoxin module